MPGWLLIGFSFLIVAAFGWFTSARWHERTAAESRLIRVTGRQSRDTGILVAVEAQRAAVERRERLGALRASLTTLMMESRSGERRQLLEETIGTLDADAVRHLVAWSVELESSEYVAALLNALLTRWLEIEPRAAAHTLRHFPTEKLDDTLRRQVHAILTDERWEDGATFALSMGRPRFQGELLEHTFARWASKDASGAAAWVAALPEGAGKQNALLRLVETWPAGETEALAALARAVRIDDVALSAAFASRWGERDPSATAEWVAQLAPGAMRDEATVALAAAWAERSPADAASFVARLPAVEVREIAALRVVSVWSNREPQEASRWVGWFPEGPLQQQALRALLQSWAQSDVVGAATWMLNLSAGPALDTALEAFSSGAIPMRPSVAFEWANYIDAPDVRQSQVMHVARLWLVSQPAIAYAAIARSSLPEALKGQLLPP